MYKGRVLVNKTARIVSSSVERNNSYHQKRGLIWGLTCLWSPSWLGVTKNSLICELTNSVSGQDAKVVPKAFQRNFWKTKDEL